MNHVFAVTGAALALAAWTSVLCLAGRRAQLRAFGVAAAPWLAIGFAATLCAAAIALRPLAEACTCAVACVALAIAGDADSRTGYLFDVLTVPAAALTLALASVSGSGLSALLGCSELVATFGAVVAISRGRAMGLGDVKAMASIGAAFGPVESLLAIAAACASGIIEAGLRGRLARRAEVRFGPHLAIGAGVALAWGEPFGRYIARGNPWL